MLSCDSCHMCHTSTNCVRSNVIPVGITRFVVTFDVCCIHSTLTTDCTELGDE